MSDKIDYLIQDNEALQQAVTGNRAEMDARGYSETKHTAWQTAGETLILKETAQQRAVKLVGEKTAEQNEAIKTTADLNQKVKEAAKSSFGKDPVKLKLFKVGEKIPNSVKSLRTLTEYMMAIVLEYHDTLLENGLTQEDMDAFTSAYGILIAADASQENAKKLQKTATMVRDDAAKTLKEQMFKIRSFAKTCFDKNPEILLQFKPIPKGKGRNNGTDNGGIDTPPVQ